MEEEENTVIDASGQFKWNRVAYSFLDKEVKPYITELNFSTNHISDMAAELLASFLTNPEYNLQILDFSQCRLTEKASVILFDALGKSKVNSLTLDRNLMTLECCKHLAAAITENENLQYLSLQSCDILAHPMSILSQAIAKTTNLHVLRLDNNSIFDCGARALAVALRTANITSLSVSDNQIWNEGMTELLQGLAETRKIVELDVSYNILPLTEMVKHMVNSFPNLKALNISGCKVDEKLVQLFLDNVPKTQLVSLMINGLSYNMLPITWPHVKDEVWSNRVYFQLLMKAIKHSPSLTDVRVGFLESEQLGRLITFIEDELHQGQFEKSLQLSLIDFGRTGNCWVATFPYFELQSPCDIFKWASTLSNANAAKDITTFVRASKFDGVSVTKVDFRGCSITNEILSQLLSGLQHSGIEEMNLSDNLFNDDAIDTICQFLAESPVHILKIENSNITDVGLAKLFHFFASNDGACNPNILSVSYQTDKTSETDTHLAFQELVDVLGRDSRLQNLTITGDITSYDAATILRALNNNETLQSLKLLGKIPEKYNHPQPDIDPNIAINFERMARTLHNVLTNPDSKCRLSEFEFPLFSQNFLYNDQVLQFWSEVESKLDENKTI